MSAQGAPVNASGRLDGPDGMARHPATANGTGQLQFGIGGIGLLGPGLCDWQSALPLLREPGLWSAAPTVVPAPLRLPATERRRAGAVVKASIVVADEALRGSDIDPADLATVFSSSTGEPLNCHLLCEALALPERLVSPTRFTNSVHNAAAGYWHIATRSRAPSTSLAAFDASFGAGLLEAAVMCHSSGAPVLLVACDVPYPEPLHALRPISDVFAVALLLLPVPQGRGMGLEVQAQQPASACGHAGLQALCDGIPAARCLPLLRALALGTACDQVLEGLPGYSLALRLASAP